MAQSKKKLLKKICRACYRLNPQVHRKAALGSHDLLGEFSAIWWDAWKMLYALRCVHPGRLERTIYDEPTITYQQAAELYERFQTFSQRMLSSR